MERNNPRIDRVRLNAALRVIEHYSNSTPESVAATGLENEALVEFMSDQFVEKIQTEFEPDSPEYTAEMHRKSLFDKMVYENAGLGHLRTEAKRLGVSPQGDIKTVLFTVLREGARFHRDNYVPEITDEAPEMTDTLLDATDLPAKKIDFVITGDEQPYVWNDERRKKFVRRALSSANLPKKFHPEDGSDDAFTDALLGKFADQIEEIPQPAKREELLEQLAYAIEVLSGEEMDTAKSHYSTNKLIQRKGATEAYLIVAGVAARLFRDEFKAASISKPISEVATSDLMEAVPDVASPINALIDIHNEDTKKLSKGQVSALLLLMGEPVPASVNLAPLIAGAGRELNSVMAYRPVQQSAREEYDDDAALQTGKKYLRMLIEASSNNPDSDIKGTKQVVVRLISGAGINADTELFATVTKHVDSHISYALTSMYKLK